MAYSSFGSVFAYKTAEDMTDYQYRAVTINGDGLLALAEAGDTVVGILTDDVVAGNHATYQYQDIAKMVAGDDVDAGDVVAIDGTGRAIVAGVGANVIGVAVAGGVENAIISVQLHLTPAAPTD